MKYECHIGDVYKAYEGELTEVCAFMLWEKDMEKDNTGNIDSYLSKQQDRFSCPDCGRDVKRTEGWRWNPNTYLCKSCFAKRQAGAI